MAIKKLFASQGAVVHVFELDKNAAEKNIFSVVEDSKNILVHAYDISNFEDVKILSS